MALPGLLRDNLSIPVVGAPLFIVSNPVRSSIVRDVLHCAVAVSSCFSRSFVRGCRAILEKNRLVLSGLWPRYARRLLIQSTPLL